MKVYADEPIEVSCQLTVRHAVGHGQNINTNKALEGVLEHRAFNNYAPQRVGSVENHKRYTRLLGGYHTVIHGGNVRVVSGAHILNVKDQYIYAPEHSRCGLAHLTVQTVNGDPEHRVGIALYRRPRRSRAVHTMFGAKKRHQIYAGVRRKDADQ